MTSLRIAASVLPPKIPCCYLVIQRSDGDWSPATKIIGVYPNEMLAEDRAAKEKLEHPHQHFGVASLRSEAHTVPNPVQMVRIAT